MELRVDAARFLAQLILPPSIGRVLAHAPVERRGRESTLNVAQILVEGRITTWNGYVNFM
jgi:hypothetical protein